MAWTTPRTYTTGELLDATTLNTHVRDNLNAVHVTYATSLPGSPFDGQIAVLSATTYQWLLRYNAGSASTYKWEFIGGTPLMAEVETSESGGNTTYGAVGTALSITLPNAGDYIISHGFNVTASGGGPDYMSYDIGVTGATDSDAVVSAQNMAAGSAMRSKRKNGLGAVALTVKYRRTSGGSGSTYDRRWIQALPVRVS